MADLPRAVGPWFVVRKLGEGGQGIVYLVRSPKRDSEINSALQDINQALTRGPSVAKSGDDRLANAKKLLDAVAAYSREDKPDELGAGKAYTIPSGPLADKAIERLKREFEILESVSSPHILRLLHTDLGSRLMIAEYHDRGTLADHKKLFAGSVLEALRAFRGLVQAVAEHLHERGVVHRDIKTLNVFVATDGRLVLGDFGIVFFEGGHSDRLTDTFERVGTRDWMPPWAHTGTRIDDVKPSFDVFSLGKVLWSMLSGRAFLPFWYWNRADYDLTKMFPDQDAAMRLVNERVLRASVVEHEDECLPSATELLARVDEAIEAIQGAGQVIGDGVMRCRMCGRNFYRPWFQNRDRLLLVPSATANASVAQRLGDAMLDGQNMTVRVLKCETCGHIELFHFPDRISPPAWGNS